MEKKFGSAKVLLVDDKGEELEKGKTPKYGDITKEANIKKENTDE